MPPAKKTVSPEYGAKSSPEKRESSKNAMIKEPAKGALLSTQMSKNAKTRIHVRCDCGFGNTLFIRGEGISTLSWEKGLPLVNRGPREWIWETDRPFSTAQFKILVNDSRYEGGTNHSIAYGQEVVVSPHF